MTLKEDLKTRLLKHGLFESEAEKVLLSMQNDNIYSTLTEVFNLDWNSFPQEFRALAWYTTCGAVIDWMNAEKPNHFAKSIFEDIYG